MLVWLHADKLPFQRSRVAAVRALALMLVWVEFVGYLLYVENQNFSLFVVTWIDL